MPPETLEIIVTQGTQGWVASGANCMGVGKSPDAAIKRALANYVQNVKTDYYWVGRVNELKAILRQPPIRSVATWDRITIEYELKRMQT